MPTLIILACVLVIFGPRLKGVIAARRTRHGEPRHKVALFTTTALTGVYGGYFGAAQVVILLSGLSTLLPGSIQRANAYKNVLAATANLAAAIVFVAISHVAWFAAGVIAAGAILGGQIERAKVDIGPQNGPSDSEFQERARHKSCFGQVGHTFAEHLHKKVSMVRIHTFYPHLGDKNRDIFTINIKKQRSSKKVCPSCPNAHSPYIY